MASADRLGYKPPQFVRIGKSYKEVYEGNFSHRGDLLRQLRQRTELAQMRNGRWVDEELEKLRVERGEPLLDVLVVGESGKVINSASTYRTYAHNGQLALSFEDLVDYVRREESFAYPLTGENDSVLLWHQKNERQVLPVLIGEFGSVDLGDYHSNVSGSEVRMARVPRGRLGSGKFAKKNVIYGRLGFWVNNRLQAGEHGSRTHIERVRFERSPLLTRSTYISPLSISDIEEKGGNLMDVIHPDVRVIRVNPTETNGDFIASAVWETVNFPNPVVLGYSALRPWLGEIPKHGLQ